jgi:RNA polymerase sigma factor (sigma-70 family)
MSASASCLTCSNPNLPRLTFRTDEGGIHTELIALPDDPTPADAREGRLTEQEIVPPQPGQSEALGAPVSCNHSLSILALVEHAGLHKDRNGNRIASDEASAYDVILWLIRCYFRRMNAPRDVLQEAGDVAQEVIVVIIQAMRAHHPIKNLKAFIRRVGKNKVVDVMRQKRMLTNQIASGSLDMLEAKISRSGQMEALRDAVEQLPQEDRQLVMARPCGNKWQDIVTHSGLSLHRARQKYNHALQQLRDQLGKTDFP